jgi:FtsZ-binding cell division protein ZapB
LCFQRRRGKNNELSNEKTNKQTQRQKLSQHEDSRKKEDQELKFTMRKTSLVKSKDGSWKSLTLDNASGS